jgi:hypothetical protein
MMPQLPRPDELEHGAKTDKHGAKTDTKPFHHVQDGV